MKKLFLLLTVLSLVSFFSFSCKKTNNTKGQADTTATIQKNVQLTLFDTIVKQQLTDWKGYDYYDWQNQNNEETKQGLEILQSIDSLDFSNKNLSSIPEEIFRCKKLKFLNLSDNKITSIPPQISDLKDLQYLDLSYNQIADLPDEFYNLTYIKTIDLEYNNFPRDQQIQIHNKMPNTIFDPVLSYFTVYYPDNSNLGGTAVISKIYDSLEIPKFIKDNFTSGQDMYQYNIRYNILIADIDENIIHYNFETKKSTTIDNGYPATEIQWSPRCDKIAILSDNGFVKVLTLDKGKVINTEKFDISNIDLYEGEGDICELSEDKLVVYTVDDETVIFPLKKVYGNEVDTAYFYFVSFEDDKIYKAKYLFNDTPGFFTIKDNRYFCNYNEIIDFKNKDTVYVDSSDELAVFWCDMTKDKTKIVKFIGEPEEGQNGAYTKNAYFYVYKLPSLELYKKIEVKDVIGLEALNPILYEPYISLEGNTIVYEDTTGNEKKITF